MTAASARPLRDLRVLAMLATLLAMLSVSFVLRAEAAPLPVENPRRTYSQGMPDGRTFGYEDGFQDGAASAYRRSYNPRVTGRIRVVMIPRTPQVVPGPRYIQGYRVGYAQGYENGYGAGRRSARR